MVITRPLMALSRRPLCGFTALCGIVGACYQRQRRAHPPVACRSNGELVACVKAQTAARKIGENHNRNSIKYQHAIIAPKVGGDKRSGAKSSPGP